MASTPFHHRDPVVTNLHKLKELAQEQNVPDAVLQQIDKCMNSFRARENYCDAVTSPSSDQLDLLFKATNEHPWLELHKEGKFPFRLDKGMMSGRLESSFIKTLVSMTNAKRILELGLFTGCGALAMAEALPADGEVVSCEILTYCKEFAEKMLDKTPHGKKVTIKVGPAIDTLKALADEGQKFDFVFMDADKIGYMDYYKVIMDRGLLAPRGTIAVDNALFQGVPYMPPDQVNERHLKGGEGIRKFNEYVKQDPRTHQVMVPIRDGVLLVRRNEDITGTF